MNQPVGCRPSSGHSRLRSFSGDCFITPTKAATWHSSLPPPPSFWFLQFFQVSSLDWIVNIDHAVSWSCNALVNFGIWLWSCEPLILWVPPNIKLLSHRWKLFFNRILLRLISTAVAKVANHCIGGLLRPWICVHQHKWHSRSSLPRCIKMSFREDEFLPHKVFYLIGHLVGLMQFFSQWRLEKYHRRWR